MKVLVLRADEIRHRALPVKLIQHGFEVAQLVQRFGKSINYSSQILVQHMQARAQFETDYFKYLNCNQLEQNHNILYVENLNSNEAIKFSLQFSPDYIVTFGCSILDSNWVDQFSNKILGIHLGLSPYYRGSGTNFFPFVNNELGALGFTLMNLDCGIDTGAIIHQNYAQIVLGDSIHSVGNRIIQNMFEDIVNLLDMGIDLRDSIKQPNHAQSKVYKKRDFTEKIYLRALDNLQSGSVLRFLSNEERERQNFPLIKKIVC